MPTPRSYSAPRGGHAPGHLRDALIEAIEYQATPWYAPLAQDDVMVFYNTHQQARWDSWTPEERAQWLTGQLWNCTDIVPGTDCSLVELPAGSTYARVVRVLRQEIATA